MPLRCGELFSRFGSCSRSFLGIISDKKNAFSPYLGTLSAILSASGSAVVRRGRGCGRKKRPHSRHIGERSASCDQSALGTLSDTLLISAR
jgi:hypothetical protein